MSLGEAVTEDSTVGPPGRASFVLELLKVLGVRVAVIGRAEPENRDVLGLAVISRYLVMDEYSSACRCVRDPGLLSGHVHFCASVDVQKTGLLASLGIMF